MSVTHTILSWPSTLYRSANRALDTFVRGDADFDRARAAVPFLYYFLLFSAFLHLEGLSSITISAVDAFVPRAPLFWSTLVDFRTTVTIVLVGNAVTALTASIFPFSRTARTVAFLGLLEYHSFLASFGGPNHQWDHWLWITFIMIFLPTVAGQNAATNERGRRNFSLIFWCAQAFLLLTYSMAGASKLVYGLLQLLNGQVSMFSPDAGALFVATQLNLMGETTPFAHVIIEHPWIAWLPFLAMLEVQTFAFVIAFRPQLHRLWGIGLILFHLGTFLTMRAFFAAPSGLIAVLLLASPFVPDRNDLRTTVESIPLLGGLARFVFTRTARIRPLTPR